MKVLSEQRTQGLFFLFFLGCAYAIYSSSFFNAWTLDDFPVIVNNTDIQSLGNFFRDSYPGRPLRELTYLFDFQLFGLGPAGWHIQQIFWHGLNAFLIWLVSWQLSRNLFISLFGSLLFLVHPVQVEVVASIANRKDSLALAFSLASLLFFAKGIVADRRRYLLFLLSLGCFLVGLTAKQNVIVLPLLFVCYEIALVPPERRLLARSPKFLLASVLLLGAGGLFWLVKRGGFGPLREQMIPVLVKMNALPPFTLDTYFQTAFKSWIFSLKNLLFPVRLAPEYVFSIPSGWLDPWVLAWMAAVVGSLGGALWLYRHSRAGFFAFCWSLAFWLPTSNLWPLSYFAADRYWYAPSFGIFLLVGLLIDRSISRQEYRWAIASAILLVLTVFTWHQNQVWRSSETLWTHAVEVNPESISSLNNLGDVYAQKGELAKALSLFHRAADLNSSFPSPQFNLGYCYEKLGDQDKAMFYFRNFFQRAAISDDPKIRAAAQQLRSYLARKYGLRLG